jgi:hypothetical protein
VTDQRPKRQEVAAIAATPGGFISQPAAFSGGPVELQNVLKLLYRPALRNEKIGLEFSTDAVLVDFSGLDPTFVSKEMLAADCDLLKRVASTSESSIQDIIRELQRGTPDGVERANRIVNDIGLTESNAAEAGGGLSLIVVVAAVVQTAQAASSAKQRPNPPSPSTTPKPPK